MKEKKKYKVDQPLKRINWSKIQTKDLSEKSFWVRVNEEKLASDDVCQMLIENFSTKSTKLSKVYPPFSRITSSLYLTTTKNYQEMTDSTTSADDPNAKKKGFMKELKHIDEKQAQNLGKEFECFC